jgi:hypothetical protein
LDSNCFRYGEIEKRIEVEVMGLQVVERGGRNDSVMGLVMGFPLLN